MSAGSEEPSLIPLPEFVNNMSEHQRGVIKKHFLLLVLACRYTGCHLPANWKDDMNIVTYIARIIFIATIVALGKSFSQYSMLII